MIDDVRRMFERFRVRVPIDASYVQARISRAGRCMVTYRRDEQTMMAWHGGRWLPPLKLPCDWATSEALCDLAWTEKRRGKVYVNLADGHHFGPFESVVLRRHDAFAREGRLCFTFRRGGQAWGHIDGWEYGPFRDVDIAASVGGRPLLAFRHKSDWYVLAGDTEHGPFRAVSTVGMFPYGPAHFSARREGRWFVVVGEQESGPYDSSPSFSVHPSGRTIVATTSRGGEDVYVDEKLVARVGCVRHLHQVFSPDGCRYAFAYDDKSGRAGLCVDGDLQGGFGISDGPWWSTNGTPVFGVSHWQRSVDELLTDGRREGLPGRIRFERGDDFGFVPGGRFCVVLQDPVTEQDVVKVGAWMHRPVVLHGKAIQFAPDGEAAFAFSNTNEEGTFAYYRGHEYGPDILAFALDGRALLLARRTRSEILFTATP